MTSLSLPSVLTQVEAEFCLAHLQKEIVNTEAVVLDASGLANFDSSALAVLLACRRHAQGQKKSFRVTGMPPRLVELATLYGILELLPN